MIWLNVYSPSSSPGHWTFTCVRAERRLFWNRPVYVEGGGSGHVPAPGCGPRVTMVGYAQSNARVSTLMRNIEASPWIERPELVEIKLVPQPAAPGVKVVADAKINEFVLNFQVKRATPPVDLKAASATAPGKPAAAAAPSKGDKA